MGTKFFALIALTSLLFCDITLTKKHLMYLASTKNIKQSIVQYKEYVKKLGKHDFEVLENLGSSLLERGMEESDLECQMLSLYGAGVSGIDSVLRICDQAMRGRQPAIQIAALQILGQMQDDRVKEIVYKAFSSPFLPIRMEASYVLAKRKDPRVVGYIEGLRQKLPPGFGFAFPDLLGLVGNKEAMGRLRHLLSDSETYTRLASILSVAKYKRDDLLKEIRSAATHPSPGEQEAAAFALGCLGDTHSLDRLRTLAKSSNTEVSLSASLALCMLEESNGCGALIEEAKKKNLFAISMLAMVKGGEDTLATLIKDNDRTVRFNAAISLLHRRDARCVPTLYEIFSTRKEDIGFLPHYSPGRSMYYFKLVPSSFANDKTNKTNSGNVARALHTKLLADSVELPEEAFLQFAGELFKAQYNELMPLLVHLLTNVNSEKSLALLKAGAQKAGAPFIRTFCHLALYRHTDDEAHKTAVKEWVRAQSKTQLLRMKEVIPQAQLPTELGRFSLDPEETSALLLQSFEAIAEKHDLEGIDILLDAIHDGNAKNRYALAGLLLKALQ